MNCVALALAVLLAPADTLPAQVNGHVLDAHSGAAVRSALVQMSGASGQRTTFTDDHGAYRFDDIVADEYVLTVLHPGYDNGRIRLRIRQGSSLTIDMPLDPVPLRMPGIHAIGRTATGPTVADRATDDADLRARLDQLGRTGRQAAGALGDLVLADIARDPPPNDPGGRQPHVLYVWGSSAGRGRILLDGATLDAPLHLGGILPPLDPEMLARAELRTAGTSPRHDGGTSYIMDFGTRDPPNDSLHVRADIDLLATGASVETPVGPDAGLLVGARRINHGLVEGLLGRRFDYGYSDALARFDVDLGTTGRVAATGFATHESIHLPRDLDQDVAEWHNLAAVVSWRRADSRATASCSRGVVDLPLLSAPGGHLRATADRCALGVEQAWTISTTNLNAGLDIEHLRFGRRSSADASAVLPEAALTVSCTPTLPCAEVAATTVSPWAEAAWQPARNVSVRAGLRGRYQPDPAHVATLPRLSVSIVNDDASTALTVSAGRFSQTNTLDSEPVHVTDSFGSTIVAADLLTEVTYATQFEIHLARRSRRSALAGSILVHRFEGGHDTAPRTSPGAELSWAWTAGEWTATLGYSMLGRVPVRSDSVTDYQHMAAASVATTRGRVTFGLSSAYGRGLPLTAVVLEQPTVETLATASDQSPTPLDDRSYFRVDARLGAEWTADLFGRPVRLTPFARLVNGLSRRDALFYYQDSGQPGEPQPLAALASLPVLGLRIDF
ncbi:MAG TPA: carboxypeptidase-like regulatory domain-containing protein [Longimicrobiales bacterium]|nr:carboxypeptidase-like regulatory domain-containing protein [Longimicrobiales bacterium]